MKNVNFQTPISGKDLKLPDLPPEEPPASDPLPKITHAKSERVGENILERGIDLFRKISAGKSRAHVRMELDKNIGARPNEKSSTVHIKTRTQKTVSFAKSGYNNQTAVRSEPSAVRENMGRTRDELNVRFVTNGLIKVAKKKGKEIDDSRKNELETAISQLFSGRGEELNESILKELKTDADPLGLIPEVRYLSNTLKEKVNEALTKKAEAAVKNLVKAEKMAMPAADRSILSSKAEMLQESQPKLSVPDMKLDELVAALDESSNIDDITAALERMEVSSQSIPNKPTSAVPLSALAKAEKIVMPAPNGSMLSAKAEKLPHPESMLPVPDMTLDEFMAALDKSDNIDEITTTLVDDELERELKQLNDQVEKLKQSRFGE